MKLEPGMRIRVVDVGPNKRLMLGAEHVVAAYDPDNIPFPSVTLVADTGDRKRSYFSHRFKPVIRVKAKCVPSLSVLLSRAEKAVLAFTPAEREAMHQMQRALWARGEAALSAMGLG